MKARLMTLLDCSRGGAWPPSVRTVRRSVKSDNERDPYHYLQTFPPGNVHNNGTAGAKPEEGRGNGRSVCPESSGQHARYKGWDNGPRHRKVKIILKPIHSSD